MAVDMPAWRRTVEEVVSGIADEALQRRAWFGIGPEQSSPDEEFCMFFDDAAVDEFLDRHDTGLDERQRKVGKHLVKLMQELSNQTPEHVEAADLIDDPRWKKIRKAAARFRALLHRGDMAA
jgi:hypothetical protein